MAKMWEACFNIINLRYLLLCGLILLPATTDAAEENNQNTSPRSDAEKPAQQEVNSNTKRSLAISKLKVSDLSATERIALKPKYEVTKPKKTEHWKGLRRNVVVVKFVDGARIREENTSAARRAKTDSGTLLSRLDALKPQQANFDQYDRELLKRKNLTPEKVEGQMRDFREILKGRKLKHWQNVFNIDDDLLAKFRINAEIQKKQQSADLANYYVFHLDDAEQAAPLADRLNELDIVELAYLAPIPENADVPPPTPSFLSKQTYLDAAPGGIDARYAWRKPGGKGGLVKIIDVENGWNLNHEDLPSVFINDGGTDEDLYRQHGTAVLAVMLGLDDGVGVTGIVPEASGGVVSVKRGLFYDNVAEAVLIAAMSLSEGDVILIEQHSRGPGNDGDCTACITEPSNCGYIAMEYWDDIFDAINAATASGIIVVEAAGNGEMNLDNARYKDRFNRNVRNSGALIVGAGDSATHAPLCFSNHGSRVDVQGWGEKVMTAGYGLSLGSPGYKINGADDNQWYTGEFKGTSSATPIVAGAVAAIQGIQIENNNPVLDWYEMSDLLVKTGTPQTGGKKIGPLPDLKAAIAQLPPPTTEVFETVITLDDTLLDADHAVSGFAGERTRDIGEAADDGAIERLNFGERSDRPCYVRVEKADIVANSVLSPHAELDICGGNGPTDRSLWFLPMITPGHDTFVRGVSVCNSKTGNSTRLKGAKLYLTRIDDGGSFSMISDPATFDRPNCDNNWRTPAMCPSGSVATKLVVHIRPDGKDEVFTGLSLKCREVKVTRTLRP